VDILRVILDIYGQVLHVNLWLEVSSSIIKILPQDGQKNNIAKCEHVCRRLQWNRFSLFPAKSVLFLRGKNGFYTTKFGLFLTVKYCQHWPKTARLQ